MVKRQIFRGSYCSQNLMVKNKDVKETIKNFGYFI